MTTDIDPKAAADAFNAAHPVGQPVRYWKGVREGDGRTGRTRSPAGVLGGHTAAVWVNGVGGCIALTHIQPIDEDELIPDQPRPASPTVLDVYAGDVPDGVAQILAALDTWAQDWHRRIEHGACPAQRRDIGLLAAYDALTAAQPEAAR